MNYLEGWYGDLGWEVEHIIVNGELIECDNTADSEEDKPIV